jgi:hypothetical protein
MRIFSSAVNFRRVALRISLTMFLAMIGSFYLPPRQAARAELSAVGSVRYARCANRRL